MRYYDKLPASEILSKVKTASRKALISPLMIRKNRDIPYWKHMNQREVVPLFEGVKDNHNDSDSAKANNEEIEEVIPIFGEEIVITKRKVKVGELVIKKNRVTVDNKIEIDIKKEEARTKHPDVTTFST